MGADGTRSYEKVRRYKRRNIDTRVGVLRRGEMGFARSVQISEGGMLLRGPVAFRVGESVEVNFYLSPSDYVSSKAEVLYVTKVMESEVLIGIRFEGLSAEAQALIQRHIAK